MTPALATRLTCAAVGALLALASLFTGARP